MDAMKYCDIGGRALNEDYVVAAGRGEIGIFVVCDGLGGHNCGNIASEYACETMKHEFFTNPVCGGDRITELLNAAQDKLLAMGEEDPSLKGMRTTAVVLTIANDKAVWAHIGDSRLYMIHEGKIAPLTADHSVAYLAYASGEITYDEIKNSPDQNRLIRSMGSEDKYKPTVGNVIAVSPRDAFLLCSDGFWEFLSQKEILDAYKKSKTASRWMAKLVRMVNKNSECVSDRDNCSAVTVII